jgi:hypothetical protein
MAVVALVHMVKIPQEALQDLVFHYFLTVQALVLLVEPQMTICLQHQVSLEQQLVVVVEVEELKTLLALEALVAMVYLQVVQVEQLAVAEEAAEAAF